MTHTSDTIAIIGTACRLPGACNLNEFWHLLSTGQDQISTLSAERWALARPHLSAQEIESVRKQSPICWGGFLDHVDQFDPSFFGISAREAVSMSPQHRLLLEIAWEALEDAALRPDQLNKTKTGVFLGLTNRDYSHLAWNHHDLEDPYLTTGNSSSIAASRISYLLNLLGPCVVVDTACSSSLVALHLACQSIRSGESTMAFAGGVNLTLDPDLMLNLAAGGFQAPDGRCKTFDSRADGYVRGEGAGIVLLKSLDRALADGDPIHGLILGSAVNQDGRTQGITAPKPTAQEAVVRQAYQQAGVSPSQVQYVETHGTGTKLGDPIELAALGKVLKEGRNPEERCLVGAVKTNIGHLEAAAGIAGLIKAVLSLQHRQIPPNLHFQSPNPYINFDRLPVEVPQTLTPWPSYGEEAIASVSAFSFGGTNAHVVLQAASERPQPVIQIERPQHLLTLSAKSLTALKDMAQRYQNHVQQTEQTLGDICHTANVGRVHHDYRLAIASTSKTDLVEKLKAFGLGEDNPSVIQGQRSPHTPSNIAFLFTGQGSQYVDMGRELYETQPTFRNALDQCAEILSRVNVPLLEIMYGEAEGGRRKAEGRRQKAEGRRQKAKRSQELGINTTNNEQSIHQTAYTQPVLFALEYALYQLWQSWGIKPSIVMGHSVGEYVAACVAGVFSLEDGLKLIAARGRLMQQLPIGGTMVSVMASAGQVRGIIAKRENGARDNIAIAAINGPESTVISGEESAIQAIAQQFETRGIKTKRLSVSHGFHSPLMEPMVAEFEQVAREISYSQPKLKLISNVTGQIVTDKVATPDYWCEHILAPVNFAAGMESLLQEEINIFLECGPQPTLLGMGRQCLPEAEEKIWLPSLRSGQDDWQQILTSLSEIYAHGGKIDWLSFDKDYPQRRRVSLPTYPFQRQRYWIDGAERHRRLGQTVHPLLGVKTELAGGETLYSQQFDPQKGWLADHQVHNTLTMPGAGFAALALASQQGPTQLHNVIFERLMLVSEPCELQFCLDTLDDSKQRRFTIYSRQRSQDETWQLHSYGHIGPASLSSECIDLERLQSRLHSRSVPQMYQQMEAMGLKFGPAFQGMQQLWGGEAEALAELMLPDTLTTAQQIEPIHPALLDACCQTLFGATDEHLDTVLYLPIQYRQIELYRSAPSHLFCYAQRVEIDTNAQTITSNLTFIDEHGEVFGRLQGFVLKRTARNALLQERTQSATHLLYETQWQSIDIHQAVEPETTTGQWLILGETDICTMLSEQLVAHGQSALWGSPHQLATLLDKGAALENGERGHDSTLAGIVLISSANADDIIAETGLNADTVLQVIQTLLAQQIQLAHGITLITQKGVVVDVADDVSPSQAALWGLGRSLQTEQPQLGVRLIDIEQIDIDCIASKYLSEVLLSQSESQVALRDNQTFIPRLVSAGQSRQLIRPIADDVALSFSQRGSLDHLTLIPHTLPTPGKGEVQLTVRAAGLNFRDVLNVLGAYPGDAGELGGEVAGIVTAVGDEVSHLTVGEPVYGFSTGSFATRCNTSAALLQKLPTAIPFAAAATIPITFCTAQEAIARLDLKAGDKILIHAAAGGVGLAAVQLAQAIGAEVYATASTGKHAYLKQLGINHIYDSRTIDFGEQIRRDTDGLGLDAVLNSLTSEGFIDATLTALAEGGRFVEIGKRDIWSAEQMAQVRADVDYHVLALDEMVVRSPHHIQHLLSDLTPRFVSGELQPLTRRLYSLSEAPTAMRFMQQARHIGKLVFTMEETAIRPDASYLITGGLGSLGLQTCEWLLAQGAQHVVLSSRRTPNEMTKQQIDTLKQSYNSVIEVHIADVTNAEQVHELIGLFGQDWPGLAGVIHAAGVLDDGVISEQTPERFARVLAPKIHGAWHLHQATRHHNLDCFVLYSSVAATLGAAGQSSYATANAFLDGLAQHRRAQGLCATSINWGPWAEGGMAMDATVRANLAKQGLTPLQAKDAHQAVAHLLAAGTPTGVVLDADWQRMGRYLGEVRPALLSQLLSQPSPTTEKGLLQQLRSAALADRLSLLMRYLQQDLQRILGFAQLPDPDVSVFDLGMDSLMAVELRNRLQQQLGNTYTVPNTLAFDYPTIRRLATHLAEQLGELPKSQPQPTQAVSRSLDGDAVAIVGLACRFPGAPDKDAYWQLLTNGVDAISEVPPDRWDINAYYDPDPDAPGKMTTRYGGFIPDIDQFDAGFFGIAPREAIELDPQQRLLLEISWQALEDANIAPASLVGSQTGVYVGLSTSDYSQLIARGGEQTIGQYMGTGTAASAAVGRLSYVLGLEGPSLAIDTACSSSLVALHQAARGLLNGDCQLALVGGVNAILSPETTIYFSKGRFMAPDGRCKTFDALADGYVRGEGCGMVVLKRLSEAERDGDRIYSIIRGSAVNQDGASGGLTVPNGPAQQRVIKQALAEANIKPEEVTYVEAHGTGTSLGDPIEIQALQQVLGQAHPPDQPLWVGSVKTNIGHLEAAAGMASVIKVALSLQHGLIPGQLHFHTPSPRIPWDAINIEVADTAQPWQGDRRVAGVSGFAFQGTNAHVVLEGYTLPSSVDAAAPAHGHNIEGNQSPMLLPISGKSKAAVQALAAAYIDWLDSHSNSNSHADIHLNNMCFTAGVSRNHFGYRTTVIAQTQAQFRQELQQIATDTESIQSIQQQGQIAMLFTGQGSQYVNMARDLYKSQPLFRQTLDQCSEILNAYLDRPLIDMLYPNESIEQDDALLNQTAYTQPALFAIEYALYQLWQSWGIQPTVVMGHSIGEIIAACVAGVISLEDGLKLSAMRGRLMQQLPPGGAMVSVMASVEQVQSMIDGRENAASENVAIAAINGPESTVISGEASVVQAIAQQLDAQGIKTKRLPVSHAFHSPLMRPMLAEFKQVARQIRYSQPKLKLISNITGQMVTKDITTPEYWCEHILAPVNFAAGMERLHQEEIDIFLECGPQPILLGMGRQCLPDADQKAWLPSLRLGQDDWQQILTSVSELYSHGVNIDWANVSKNESQRRKIDLPTYPFQRQRYWIEPPPQPTPPVHQGSATMLQAPQTLLGERLSLPLMDQIRFQTRFSAAYPTYLVDHQYYDRIVAAGTSHLVMALLAAQQSSGHPAWSLNNIQFLEVLGLTEKTTRTVQVVLDPQGEQGYTYQLISCSAGQEQASVNEWKVHAKAELKPMSLDASGLVVAASDAIAPSTIQQRCSQMFSRSEYYATLLQPMQGRFKLGESFQWTEQAWLGEGEALLKLRATSYLVNTLQIDWPHPGLLDSGMVMIPFLKTAQSNDNDNSLPTSYAFVGARSCQFFQSFNRDESCWFYVKLSPSAMVDSIASLSGDAYLLNNQGEVLVAFTDVQFRELKPQVLLRAFGLDLNDWQYQLSWQPLPLVEDASLSEHQDGTDQVTTNPSAPWLLFVPSQPLSLGDELAVALDAQGYRSIKITPGDRFQQQEIHHYQLNPTAPDQFQQLLQEFADRTPQGIIHLWSLDTHLQDLTQAQALSCGSSLHLLQAMHSVFQTNAPPLWLMTQGAQRLGQDDQLQPQQAALWGLGRVIALEYPHIRCACIDLEPGAETVLTLQSILQELQITDDENQIAYRQGERHGARLSKLPASPDASTVQIQADGSYCITGGLGTLGLQVAQWLVNRGARQLILMGRRSPGEIAQRAIAQLKAAGATVTVISADIANFEATEALLTQIDKAQSPLRGVIHAAGVLDDGFLQQQTWERFVTVMQPKVQGAWNLHYLTQHLPLDFFVCFSSATALLGNPGQGNYAAANAFMDALMQERYRQGLPGLSINWGAWADSGMAAQLNHQAQQRMQAQGIKPLETGLGLQALEQAISGDKAQLGIFAVDWPQFIKQFDGQIIPPALTELAEELALTVQQGPRLMEFIEQLQQADQQQRQLQLVDYLTGMVTKVLRRSPGDRPQAREGFFNLGMDSLMAMELVTTIQRDLGLTLSGTAAFEYANIEELAGYLETCLPLPQSAKRDVFDVDLETDAMTDIRQMSVEDLQTSLLQELNQLEANLQLPKH